MGKTLIEVPHQKENVFLHNLNFISIPAQERCLLVLIAFRNQVGTCKHSNAQMGEILGCTRSRIVKQLKYLVDEGYVKIINPNDRNIRSLEITEKTENILKANSQSVIDEAKKVASSRQTKPKLTKPETKPSTKPETKPRTQFTKPETKPHNKNSFSNKNYEEIIEPDSTVVFQTPFKSGLKSTIEADHIKEIIRTEKGINEITPKGFTREHVLNAVEVFIAAKDREQYTTVGFLKYEFMEYVREYADMPF